MAILPSLSGIQADVLVNGAPCHEFNNPDDAGEPDKNHVVSYIQSQTGAAFAVKLSLSRDWQYAHKEYALDVELLVDGSRADALLIHPVNSYSQAKDIILNFSGVKGITDNGAELRGFRFAHLQTGSAFDVRHYHAANRQADDRALEASDSRILTKIRELGDITIKLYRVEVIGPSKIKISNPTAFDCPDLGRVPEKALKGKAISQQTQ
jgi:hypothetical protein